jgi:hypothetical protein
METIKPGRRKAIDVAKVTSLHIACFLTNLPNINQLALSLHRKQCMFYCLHGFENFGVFATSENQLKTNPSRSLRSLQVSLSLIKNL